MGFFDIFEPFYCKEYKVKGTNPKTGRKKTVYVVATSSDKEAVIIEKSGLLPPYEVSTGSREITDGQRGVAKKYFMRFPKDATLTDASLLLDRKRREREGEPIDKRETTYKMIKYAADNNVCIPKYANYEDGVEILLRFLPEKEKEIKEMF